MSAAMGGRQLYVHDAVRTRLALQCGVMALAARLWQEGTQVPSEAPRQAAEPFPRPSHRGRGTLGRRALRPSGSAGVTNREVGARPIPLHVCAGVHAGGLPPGGTRQLPESWTPRADP